MSAMKSKVRVDCSDFLFNSTNKLPDGLLGKLLGFGNIAAEALPKGELRKDTINASDPEIFTVALDGAEDLVLVVSPVANYYILVWGGTKDQIDEWLRTHRIAINPVLKSLQIFESPTAEKPTDDKPSDQKKTARRLEPLFRNLNRDTFLSLGVPEEMLEAVSKLKTKKKLYGLRKNLPQDVYESLRLLADGAEMEEVLKRNSPDEEDGNSGTEEPTKGLRTVGLDSKMLEQAVFDGTLTAWRIFLHPDQQKIVNLKPENPVLVRGSAGTGKTVVAMHRAVRLIRDPKWDRNKKLLFTTYTANLAVDIGEQIKTLCTEEEAKLIQVTNLDKWVYNFLRQRRVGKNIVYPGSSRYEKCWGLALTLLPTTSRLKPSFAEEEWKYVILPNGISRESEYLRASRKGRGMSITRNERKILWTVFEEMREQLAQNKLMTFEDACYMAKAILESEPGYRPYGAVVVDETQDIGPEGLKLLAELARIESTNVVGTQNAECEAVEPRIFMVGDGQQRIYQKVACMSDCGINIKGRRSHRLKVTYRTTEEIKEVAEAVLAGNDFDDMDKGVESRIGAGAIRTGLVPIVESFDNMEQEVGWIASRIKELKSGKYNIDDNEICIVTRTQDMLEEYGKKLEDQGFKPVRVQRKQPDNPNVKGLRLATMHRVKGLEFKVVFVVGANEGEIPHKSAEQSEDAIIRKRAELTERSLLYVAMSRARDVLFLSSHGKPGSYLLSIKKIVDAFNEDSE